MKHYLEIENLREQEVEIVDGITRERNDFAFEPGDAITITEKYDGANASITWEDGEVHVFSHKRELDPLNTLQGFYTYAMDIDPELFREFPDYIFFGEWNLRNAIRYENAEPKTRWLVFDVYDKKSGRWLLPGSVKLLCSHCGFEYIAELYAGEFISWDECRKYSHKNTYGSTQEGIVVRNITKMNGEIGPWILKIVNEEFKETKKAKHRQKIEDPQKLKEKERARELMESVATRRRVEKMLCNLRDDGILPEKITPQHMGIVAKNLPKRVWEDCLKEEKETVFAAGEYAGRECSKIVMGHAKEIILEKR